MKGNNIPNLFIVGEPKSGTTAIYNYLRQHPQIYFPEMKEPKYFCKDLHRESDNYNTKRKFFPIRTKDQYLEMYESNNGETYLGDASPLYLRSKVAAKEIYNFNPEAKIIIMLREPVGFLYSLHSHAVRDMREDIVDFEKALDFEKIRKEKNKFPKAINFPSYLFYSEWINYKDQIKRYFDKFPKSNIKILFYEDFKKNNNKILKEIFDFLELKYIQLNEKKVNERKEVRSFKLLNLMRNLKNQKFIEHIPLKWRKKLGCVMERILTRKSKNEELSRDKKNYLKKRYNYQVKELDEFFYRNNVIKKKGELLEKWDYNV